VNAYAIYLVLTICVMAHLDRHRIAVNENRQRAIARAYGQ